jgi:dihydropteroate synthase
MKGEPRTMQDNPHYDDLMGEVRGFLADRIETALKAGIARDRILVDPGIGFGKRLEDNFELLGRLKEFYDLGPVLVGPSRKSFIGAILSLPVEQRQFGTAAAVAVATLNGADVIRVHDVREMRQATEIASRCLMDPEREETADRCEPST